MNFWITLSFFILTTFATQAEVHTSVPKKAFITIQEEVHYTITDYTPVLDILDFDVPEQELHASPENVASMYIRSMVFNDYDRYISLWNSEERKRLMAKHAVNGQTKEFWQNLWVKTFAEIATVSIHRKVESDNFIIMEVIAEDGSDQPLAIDVPIVRQNKFAQERYYITDQLESHPLFVNWRRMGQIIQK